MNIKGFPARFVFVLLACLLTGAPAFASGDCSWGYEGTIGPEH